MMTRLNWLLAPSGESLSFALRTCVSVAIVLYLAFWMGLDNPYWAFMNLVILIQPLPGFMVVRGFARLVGTFVAGTVAVAMVALFAQSYTLLSVALTCWLCAMVFLASLYRNNLSYGFVLAGYVTAVIGVRAMNNPDMVFSVALARAEETALATLVAATVSVLLAPGTTHKKYLNGRIEALRALGSYLAERARAAGTGERAGSEDEGDNTEESENENESRRAPTDNWLDLVGKTASLEQTRRYARFDTPGFEQYDRLARRLNYELLSVFSAITSLQTYLAQARGSIDRRPLGELEEAATRMAEDPGDTDTIKTAFDGAYQRVQQAAWQQSVRRRSLGDWVIISRTLDLANRVRAAVTKHEILLAERGGDRAARRESEFTTPRDLRGSIRTTFRAGTAIAAGAAIWATHAEPTLAGTMVLLSVLTTLFALGDNPVAGARGFGAALLIAGAVAFVVNFLLLPLATTYISLMLVILPVVFVGALAMATPAYALVGRVGLVIFALLVHPANSGPRQTFISFAETFMGAGLAVLLALVAFSIILPVSPRQLLRERTAGILEEIAHGFEDRREHFETRVYDRIQRLPVTVDEGAIHSNAGQAAFAAANIGIEARTLRLVASRAAFTSEASRQIEHQLEDLAVLFEADYPSTYKVSRVRGGIDSLAETLLGEALTFHRRRRRRYGVRAAVAAALVASALADYAATRQDPDMAESAATESAHAT